MKPLRISCALALLSVIMSGCSVRSSQLSGILEVFQASTENYMDSAWLIRYGDYRAQVQALSFEGGVLFSNREGDQLYFNGWTITRASGLGTLRGRWSVDDDSRGRHFTKRNRRTTFPSCSAWQSLTVRGVTEYTQTCPGVNDYENSILVNSEGEITLIRQSLSGGSSFVTLSKL